MKIALHSSFWAARALGGLLLLLSGRAVAETGFSLADAYPPDRLETILASREAWKPFPALADREGWRQLPATVKQTLVERGETTAAREIPALPATLYLEYRRQGDRSRFQSAYFDRREMLQRLVLAECVERQGRFVDPVANVLWAICEETSWCLPAHVGGQKAGVGLPDIDEPILDLFAAQTAVTVAWSLHLLGDEAEGVSPMLRRRAEREVDRQVLTPFLERDFGWMGFGGGGRPNNWNPWINASVLSAALCLEADDARRVRLVHRALQSLDRFLQPYPKDGSCDEGPGYWSRAGASVLDCLDWLHRGTGGRLDVFAEPLIGEMGRFIYRAHIADDWYVNIGDCPARVGMNRDAVFRYGRRIGDGRLADLATGGATLEELVDSLDSYDFGRALFTLEDIPAILAGAEARPPMVRDVWLGSEDMQMMVARDRPGTTEGFLVAAWGGHNAQSHNHNDVGNVIVFVDGQPVLIDLGAPEYTAQTFSSRRYEIPAMRSDFHNLPTVNGTDQGAGRAFAAREVTHAFDDAVAELGMELASAWPGASAAKSWRRTVRLERGKRVVVTDAFQLESAEGDTRLNWITPGKAEIREPGRLVLSRAAWQPPGPNVVMGYDPDRLQAKVEPVELGDSRLERTWGGHVNRILLRGRHSVLAETWSVQFEIER